MTHTLHTEIDITKIQNIAIEAGQAILKIYHTDFNVTQKSDKSPLTEADLTAHHIIVSGLETLTPKTPILSEESAKIPYTTRQSWDSYWLVDPLDGTREFVNRNGEFTVNIALIEQGIPTLGVIYVPVTDTLYYGATSLGAFKQQAQESAHSIYANKQVQDPIQVAGSRSHAGNSLASFLDNLPKHEMRSMGSSLKFCLIAEGLADIYPRLGPTSEWDTGAAQAIVTAAGGQVTTLDMQPLKYNTKDSLLNPFFLVFGAQSIDWSQYLENT